MDVANEIAFKLENIKKKKEKEKCLKNSFSK